MRLQRLAMSGICLAYPSRSQYEAASHRYADRANLIIANESSHGQGRYHFQQILHVARGS